MKNILIRALAITAGIFAEKKYKVSGKAAELLKKYTGKNLFGEEPREPEFEVY